MKINSITSYPALLMQKPKYGLEHEHSESVDFDNKSVNRGYYSGSFTGKEKAAAKFFSEIKYLILHPIKSMSKYRDAVIESNTFDKLLDGCNNHTTIMQNLVALFLALGPRPLAIMSLPGKKNKEDKIYASGHAMASGLIGFGFSTIVMYPLGAASKKVKDGDAKLIKSRFDELQSLSSEELINKNITKEQLLEGTKILKEKFLKAFGKFNKEGQLIEVYKKVDLDNMIKAINMAPDTFVFGIAKAMLTVALIPPILKYVFGIEKSKPPVVNQQGGAK